MNAVGFLKKALPPLPRQLLRGLSTYLPGASRAWAGTGGTDSAAYCYEVFLKHLSLCAEAGMAAVPRSVAEIGPHPHRRAHSRALHRLFEVRTELLLEQEGGLPHERLRAPFDALDPRERRTAGYFVVAVKR